MKVLMLGWEFPPHISGGLGTACFGLTQGLAHHGVEVLFVVPRAHGDEDARFATVVGANEVVIEESVSEPSRRVPTERVEEGEDVVEERVRIVVPVPADRELRGEALEPEGARVEGSSGEEQPSDEARMFALDEGESLAAARAERVRRSFELLAVDSLLRPYLTERDYVERLPAFLRTWAPVEQRADAAGEPPKVAAARFARGLAAYEHGSLAAHEHGSLAAHEHGSLAAQDHQSLAPQELRERVVTVRRRIPWRRVVQDVREVPGQTHKRRRLLEFSGAYGANLMDEVARYALAVEELARKREFDVIHAHDWMSVPAGLAAARVSKKPLVVHVHACEHDRSGERVNVEVKAIEQLGLDGADRVVCVSHYTAGQLKRHYRVDASKLRVVHNALTQKEQKERVHVEKKIGEPIVLFLGRVTFQKGPEYFLEAALRVVRVRPDVKFVIAGSGDMLSSTIERTARMGLARNVHFTGFLQGEDVERMYAMADVYVMPSVSEPFGISPLEAMALDTPVILSRQSGVAEVLRNALKVDFWDVADMANKILALLNYPALVDQLKDEGREEVRGMRWEHPAALVRDVYRELAGAR